MEDKFIEIGGKKLKLIISYRICYNLIKYRNTAATGIDLSKASKKTLKELEKFYTLVAENGGEYNLEEIAKLSPETQEFLVKETNNQSQVFSADDTVNILMTMTGIDETEANELLDKEVQLNGFDGISNKIMMALNMFFMSAKGGQSQETNQTELKN